MLIKSPNLIYLNTVKINNQDMGENIAMCWGTKMTGDSMTNMWYNEVKDYNFQKPGDGNGTTGQFTQVVWKGSTDVGFGLAKNSGGKYYAVGNYFPAGNYQGEYKGNVFPKK